MATIYQVGSTWYTSYRVNGRRVRESLGTHDKAKAMIALKARLGDVARARQAKKMGLTMPEDSRDAKLTLGAFLDRFQAHYINAGGPALRASREQSWKKDVAALRSVLDFLGRQGVHLVAKVEGRHIQAFRDWRLTTGVSAATVNKAIRCGRAAWSWAIEAGLARGPHPFGNVKAVKTPGYEPRALSDVEVRKLLNAAMGDWHFPLIALAIYAGLRRGELIALEWPDIDFHANEVRVRCSETFNTKSRKPRTIPLAPELRAILEPLKHPTGLVLPSPRPANPDVEQPLEGTALTHAFEKLGKAAGVEFTPHDLRRTFASMLAARGVPITRIRDYPGHASTKTTETYYVERGAIAAEDVARLSFGIVQSDKARASA